MKMKEVIYKDDHGCFSPTSNNKLRTILEIDSYKTT